MKAKSIRGNSAEEIQNELTKSAADGFKPTLAFVFLSLKQDRAAISRILDKVGIAVFGCTTHGEFIDEELSDGAVAILLMDLDPSAFNIFFEEFTGNNYADVAKSIAGKTLEKFANPSFLIAGSNLQTDAEALLAGFKEIVGEEVVVFGGMAGDDISFTEQFVFTGGADSNNGIVAIAFDNEKVSINGRAICGWRAVGTVKTVTKSDGHNVFAVDDMPVLELTQKYGGFRVDSMSEHDAILHINLNFPLQLQREKGEPIMRPGIKVNFKDGSLFCPGSVPEGSKVRFSLPPDFDVMETVIKGMEEIKATSMPQADALIVFSCGGRRLSFGPMISVEIEEMRKVWNVPMAGMFSNAEMGRTKDGDLEMHNLTTCCVALKER